MPIVQHPAHGGDGGALGGPCLPASAGAPVGALCAQAAALFMQRDGAVLNMVLRIFLRVISQSLSTNCHSAASVDKAALHIGAVAFIHRFGSGLNGHVHLHLCAVDGVYEEVALYHRPTQDRPVDGMDCRR